MASLNATQLEAVRYLGGPLLVLAGAGSGKTRVITHKIAWLLSECGYRGHHVAAVTFTNKAAREMRDRVASLLPGRATSGLRVSTFHTLGLELLRRELDHAGRRAGFSIYDEHDCRQLLAELIGGLPAGQALIEPRLVQWQISRWKSDLIGHQQARDLAHSDITAVAAALYPAYDRRLQVCNAVDFDDLIGIPVRILEALADRREVWQNRLRYLLVDEYQDTNHSQYRLIRLLTGPRAALAVVGDDDQSVYGWRGARPEHLRTLQQDYPGLRVIKLEQNYRSTTHILAAANRLIANNPHVFEKRLWSELTAGERLRVVECEDGDQEPRRVVAELLHHKIHNGARAGDYAILYRSNHQSRMFEKALREHQIPYRISGGRSFFSHPEIRDVLAYLRLAANPGDDSAFMRVINTPRRDIGTATLEKLATYAGSRGVSLLHASAELGLGQTLQGRPLQRLRRFAEWMSEIRTAATRDRPATLLHDLLRHIDYEGWLRGQGPTPAGADRRIANVGDLLDWVRRIEVREQSPAGIHELVSHLSLMDVLDRQEQQAEADQVVLMTLHAAKGLEFDHVFMVGMEEGILPHRVSLAEDTVEEERRLAYVGITRARRSLTFSLAKRRKRQGEWLDCEPSRFLLELDPQQLQWSGRGGPVDHETRLRRGQEGLATLRSMLS